MKNIKTLSMLSLVFLYGCATSKFVLTGNIFPEHLGTVKVLYKIPENLDYEEVGIISSSGGMAHEWTHLIEALQEEAAKYGANAIYISKEEKERYEFLIYNKQTGLTGSSSNLKSMTAVAIRIKGIENQTTSESIAYIQKSKRNVVGVETFGLPYFSSGYGGTVWFGIKNIKMRAGVAELSTPDAYLRDGFQNDNWKLTMVNFEYYFKRGFEGFWIGSGFGSWDGNVGHKEETLTGDYEYVRLGFNMGYSYKFYNNMYVNIWGGAYALIVGDSTTMVGSRPVYFDEAVPIFSVDVGIHY